MGSDLLGSIAFAGDSNEKKKSPFRRNKKGAGRICLKWYQGIICIYLFIYKENKHDLKNMGSDILGSIAFVGDSNEKKKISHFRRNEKGVGRIRGKWSIPEEEVATGGRLSGDPIRYQFLQ